MFAAAISPMTVSSIDEGPVPLILYQDDALVVVDKPAGMPVQPDRTGDVDLVQWVGSRTGLGPVLLVHRLDRPVSGVVVLARTEDALRTLHKAFRERTVTKRYLALVEGGPTGDRGQGMLEHVLRHDHKAHRSRAREANPTDRDPQRLHYRVLAQGERLALLEVVPQGGSFHQIRAQLAAMGWPIRGDVKYGARRGLKDRTIALRASFLGFMHPSDGRAMAVEAPLPTEAPWPSLLALARARPAEDPAGLAKEEGGA